MVKVASSRRLGVEYWVATARSYLRRASPARPVCGPDTARDRPLLLATVVATLTVLGPLVVAFRRCGDAPDS
jgi:hypothetical protein